MSKILITGANGFTGRYLTQRLVRDGHEIHSLDRHPARESHPNVMTAHIADLCDSDAVIRIVNEVNPHWVIHLAAIAFVAHANVSELYNVNIIGTRNLLNALACGDSRPEAILVASSANVYGNQRDGVLSEDIAVSPANDYGVSKVACENLVRIYSDRLPIIVTRPFNYTGVGQSSNYIVPKIVNHALEGRNRIELGNIDVARDFSDVRSVVDCYARLLAAPKAAGGVFNICSGVAHPLADILSMVQEVTGQPMEVNVNPAFVRKDEVKFLRGSLERLESVIGPVGMPALQDTLRWMLGR